MRLLKLTHPAQLLLGVALVVRDLARKYRVPAIAALAGDAIEWARINRDVHREIVCDAEYGEGVVVAAMSDGVVTADEAREISKVFSEIRQEALNGEIV